MISSGMKSIYANSVYCIRKLLPWRCRLFGSTASCEQRDFAASSSSSLLDDFSRYCYQRDLPRAMETMVEMHARGNWADSVTYSELVKCCLSRGAVEEGRLVYRHLCFGRYSPKTFLLNVLLNMFVRFGLQGEAEELFDKMPERNVVSWTTLIATYANTARSDRALELMTLMLREGVEPNGHTYSAVLKACGGLSKLRELHCSALKGVLHRTMKQLPL
ncbi:hypothetical protein MLD38_022356 [Melastoma candidum]|uniref:Uncharacterized protein n=1 Tax=Melastoma candidum TaxID=119954 RepID=A0ACB9QMW7_9MYRT|nr:hypothetical protein MLD38_022356 [Melastoma candidum]